MITRHHSTKILKEYGDFIFRFNENLLSVSIECKNLNAVTVKTPFVYMTSSYHDQSSGHMFARRFLADQTVQRMHFDRRTSKLRQNGE